VNPADRPLPASNPFATRWVRPGAIPYLFPPGEGAAELVDRLRDRGWRGQVVGPHGSGKSTLLAALMPELRRAGKDPVLIALHDGQRRLAPTDRRALPPAAHPAILILDGYEQLGRWARFLLRSRCRRYGHGLLVTAHAPVGLPDLFRTTVTAESAQAVVDHLTPPGPGCTVTQADVRERLDARSGNLREALFDLYDLHERRARGGDLR
jgi:hypothetical protein